MVESANQSEKRGLGGNLPAPCVRRNRPAARIRGGLSASQSEKARPCPEDPSATGSEEPTDSPAFKGSQQFKVRYGVSLLLPVPRLEPPDSCRQRFVIRPDLVYGRLLPRVPSRNRFTVIAGVSLRLVSGSYAADFHMNLSQDTSSSMRIPTVT